MKDPEVFDALVELLDTVEADTTNYKLEASERAKNAMADAHDLIDKRKIEGETCGCEHPRGEHTDGPDGGGCRRCLCQAFHHLDEQMPHSKDDPTA